VVSQPDCPYARSVTRLEEIETLVRLCGTYLINSVCLIWLMSDLYSPK
jgi:hypothetical protein